MITEHPHSIDAMHDVTALEAWTARHNAEAALRLTPEVRQLEDLSCAYSRMGSFLADPTYQFGEHTIIDLHSTLSAHIPDIGGYPGKYFTAPRRIISSLPWQPKPFVQGREKIPAMKELGEDYGRYMKTAIEEPKDIEYVIENAVDTMTRLEDIHPFVDGNGRLGRLLVDGMLLKGGLSQIPYWINPEIDRVSEEKLRFFRMVEDARLGDRIPLTQLIVREEIRALSDQMKALETDERTKDLIETRYEISKQRAYLQYLERMAR